MRILLLLALILSLIVTVFAVQNNAPIAVSFLSWDVSGSLALILMVTFAVGILIGILVMIPSSIRARLSARDERKRKQSLEQQLERTKTEQAAIPATSPSPEMTSTAGEAPPHPAASHPAAPDEPPST